MDWNDFRQRLAHELARLPDDAYLIVQGRGGLPYVQALRRPGALDAEAVGNAFLPRPLGPGQEKRMATLGWRAPDGGRDNWHRPVRLPPGMEGEREGECDRLAERMVAALREVYGTPSPADLTYQAHQNGPRGGPLALPELGIPPEGAEPDPAPAGPLGWPEFAERLARELYALRPEMALVVQQRGEDSHYVQAFRGGAGIRAEAVSSRALPPALRFEPTAEEALATAGWQRPTPHPNWTAELPLDAPPEDHRGLAAKMVTALCEVQGARIPGDLSYEAFSGATVYELTGLGIPPVDPNAPAERRSSPPLPGPPTAEPPTADPPTHAPPTTDPPTYDPPTYEPQTLDPPTYEPQTLDPPTYEPQTLDPPTYEPQTLDPPTYEPGTADRPAYEPPAHEPRTADPPVYEPPVRPYAEPAGDPMRARHARPAERPVREPVPVAASAAPASVAARAPGPVDPIDLETRLVEARERRDHQGYLRLLLDSELHVPGRTPDRGGAEPRDYLTAQFTDGTYMLAFTSSDAMERSMRGRPAQVRRTSFATLAEAWPRRDLHLAINPGLPSAAYIDEGTVRRLAQHHRSVAAVSRPLVAEGTVLQKAVPPQLVVHYLEGGYDRVAGYVHRLQDVATLDTPERLVRGLGLMYVGSPFSEHDESIHVISWPVVRPGLYRIPYGGVDETSLRAMPGGWVVEKPPFPGTGFAPGEADGVPEFKADSHPLPHGAEMHRLARSGDRRPVAVYDADARAWIPQEGR